MEKVNRRLLSAVSKMNEQKIDVLIITSTQNISYLFRHSLKTGKRLSAAMITSNGDTHLIINDIFFNQIEEGSNMKIHYYKDGENPIEKMLQLIPFNSHVGIDQAFNIQTYLEIKHRRMNVTVTLSDCIEKLREIKDDDEINLLRQSSRIADAVMHQIVQLQYHPTTEETIAKTIQTFFEEYGVTDLTFSPIVASGRNTVNPHHSPADKFIESNQPLLIDLGGNYKGYCSDMTRMFSVDEIDKTFLSYYEYLQEAQRSVLEIIKPGIEMREIDYFIRECLKKRDLESLFIHGTGHGIGLEAHELPYIHNQNKEIVKEGMVVTIGPGIYLEGRFGLRIEDVICVTKNGNEQFNNLTKDLVLLENQ